MRWGVVTFPGSLDDGDAAYALEQVLGDPVVRLWHKDRSLHGVDCAVLPGGFSYGDYLRAGALARFSPVMESVVRFARDGGLVVGICNGFQILCEAGLLPGVLMRNQHLEYRCQWTNLRAERTDTSFSRRCTPGQVLAVPVSHGEGNYYADAPTLARLEEEGRVLFRYCDAAGAVTPAANPNGSAHNIAGIINEGGNVLGMMPHPERACEALLGSSDGNRIFQSIIDSCRTR
jgi:phosphoribosylformylglycinamidine synthase